MSAIATNGVVPGEDAGACVSSLDGLLIFLPYRASYMCMIAIPFPRLMVTMTLTVCIRIALGYWAAHEEKRVALSPEALV